MLNRLFILFCTAVWMTHSQADVQVDIHLVPASSQSPQLIKTVYIAKDFMRVDRFVDDVPHFLLYDFSTEILYTVNQQASQYSQMKVSFQEHTHDVPEHEKFETRLDAAQRQKVEETISQLLSKHKDISAEEYQATLDTVTKLQREFYGRDYLDGQFTYLRQGVRKVNGTTCRKLDMIKDGQHVGDICIVDIAAIGMTETQHIALGKFMGMFRKLDTHLLCSFFHSNGEHVLPIEVNNYITKKSFTMTVTHRQHDNRLFTLPHAHAYKKVD